MVAGNKKNRSSRRVGHGKGDGYALHCFEEVQNCPTTGTKSRGGLRRCSFGTPGKEEFGDEGKGQQKAKQSHHSGLVAGAGHGPAESEEEKNTPHRLAGVETVDAGRAIRQTDCSHDSHLLCVSGLGPRLVLATPSGGCFVG